MLKTVKVIYPQDSLARGFDSHQFRRTDHVMDIDVEVEPSDSYEFICSKVVRIMNRVDGSEIEQQLEHYQERSIMPGDIIQADDKRYRLKMVGFEELNNE